MKRIIILFLFIFSISLIAEAQNSIPNKKAVSVTNDGVNAYNKGDFQKAIQIWKTEISQQKSKGLESADLYYNLGNAYYRSNNLAKSRLYYEKALLLKPSDRDIQANAKFITSRTEDKILVANNFFLASWISTIQNIAISNTWAIWSIIFFILFIIILFLFLFTRTVLIKKAFFYSGILLIILVIITNIFAYKQKSKIKHNSSAIIMVGQVNVVSSPNSGSQKVFVLHEGTKVQIIRNDGNWYEIEIDNGSIGWLEKNNLEVI